MDLVLALCCHGSVNLGLDESIEPTHAFLCILELFGAFIALFNCLEVLLVLVLELFLEILDLFLGVDQLLSKSGGLVKLRLVVSHSC